MQVLRIVHLAYEIWGFGGVWRLLLEVSSSIPSLPDHDPNIQIRNLFLCLRNGNSETASRGAWVRLDGLSEMLYGVLTFPLQCNSNGNSPFPTGNTSTNSKIFHGYVGLPEDIYYLQWMVCSNMKPSRGTTEMRKLLRQHQNPSPMWGGAFSGSLG